jgi:uncharacterized protein (DUF697 family)/energy-coupling factor transporter ATP-binding protein EcfA2
MSQIDSAIVRLWSSVSAEGATRHAVTGAGFLVGDGTRILTCDHVVAESIADEAAGDDGTYPVVMVDFPLVEDQQLLRAQIDFRRKSETEDTAGLTLLDDPPAGAEPATLIVDPPEWEDRFRAFGVPEQSDSGEWAHGVILGRNSKTWIQIEAEGPTGRRVRKGYSGTAVYDVDEHGVVGMVVAADKLSTDRVAFMIPVKTMVEAWSDVLQSWSIRKCPYLGISPFEENDFERFFGREDSIEEVLRSLDEGDSIAVIAESGSGKSSLLRAGIAASLRDQGWEILVVKSPGRNPLTSLAVSMLQTLPVESDGATFSERAAQLASALLDGGMQLELQHALVSSGKDRMLVVIDQLEEVFVQCRNDAEREAFLNGLADIWAPSRHGTGQVVIALGMREDYLSNLEAHRQLYDLVSISTVGLAPLNEMGLREAIEGPAARSGVRVEDALVEQLVCDLGDAPGMLPHLQYTLTRLWYGQNSGTITIDSYQKLGGVSSALSLEAEKVYVHLSAEEQAAARRVFVQLVDLGVETKGSRRPICEADLLDGDWAIVERLADEFLVVTGVDADQHRCAWLAHEAIVDGWPRLREWVDSTAEHLWLLDRDAELIIRKFTRIGAGIGIAPGGFAASGILFARLGLKLANLYGIDIAAEKAKVYGASMASGVTAVMASWTTALFIVGAPRTPATAVVVGGIAGALIAAATWAAGTGWQYYFKVLYIGGGAPTREQVSELVKEDFRNRLHAFQTSHPRLDFLKNRRRRLAGRG